MTTGELIPEVKHTIAVASGKGGVGKSTVSVNLAVALARAGKSVGLMDVDAYGPNVPGMMGIEHGPSKEGDALVPPQRHGVKVMSTAFFLEPDAPVIWRGPMLHSMVQQFLRDVAWGALDVLIFDLPPGTGDAQLSLAQIVPLGGAVIVTTPQGVALSDVVRSIAMFNKVNVPILGVVENMQSFHCPQCGADTKIFGEGGAESLRKKYDVPVLGGIPLVPRICEAADQGQPIVIAEPDGPVAASFMAIAAAVMARVKEVDAPVVSTGEDV